MARSITGSALNAGMWPSLVAGNGGKGMIAASAQPGNIPQPIKSGQLWVDSFGNNRYKLGMVLNAPGKFWNDLDLFQVTASNNMLLSDVFIWKLVSTSAMNSITTILAPKVAVPNDIHTFTGRTMYYHVQPANDVPKRGTVRTMSKSMEEWVAHLSQKGMGSHIEGGALRTAQGKRFLDQEVIAIAWSIELNMVLNTVNTIINAAIVSSFNYSRVESPVINALSMARALYREIEIFCAGCGTTRTLQALLSQYIETVPNADVLYMTNKLASNLLFANEIPGSDLPHKSYAMIPDENGVSVPVSIVGRNRTRTLKTIAGGTISVLAMPTFGFRGGESRYNPLEHDFTCGSHWILNAERGLVSWDKLSVPNSDSKSSYYCSDMLNQDIYDHNTDRRERVDFKTAIKYAHVFNTVGDRYHFLSNHSEKEVKNLLEKLYSNSMIIFADKHKEISVSASNHIFDRLTHSNSYIVNILEKSGVEPGVKKTGMIVNEAPISSDVQVISRRGNNSNDRVGFHEAVQRFKENIQFPLSRTYDPNDVTKGLTKFQLPTTVGDLDPFHLLGVNFKSCVHDAKQELLDLFKTDQYSDFRELKRLLTSAPFNPAYWEAVQKENEVLFEGFDQDALNENRKNYFLLSDYAVGQNVVSNMQAWPLDHRTKFMRIPSYEKYVEQVGASNAQPEEEYIPQGMWSLRGLQSLSSPSIFHQTKVNRLAESALQFLSVFARKVSELFPFSTVSNARDKIGSLLRFLPANTIISQLEHTDGEHGITSETDMQQIIMSLFDEKQEMVAVSLKRVGKKTGEGGGEGEVEVEGGAKVDIPEAPGTLNLRTPKDESHKNAREMTATVYLVDNNADKRGVMAELHATGPAWTFFPENRDPENDENFVDPRTITKTPATIDEGEPRWISLSKLVKALMLKIGPKITPDTEGFINDSTLKELLNAYNVIFPPRFEAAAEGIEIHIVGTRQPKSSSGFYLTPFMVSASQVTVDVPFVSFHNMNNLQSNKDLSTIREEHAKKIRTIRPAESTTGWRSERIDEFVINPIPKKQWTVLDKIISLFVIETQISLPSVDNWIVQGIRPYFEICLWRLFQRQRFEGLLLAKSGISTAMNPYNNAHISMGVDATTDQYNVRAVIQTDCVVTNSQNLAFIPCVSPTQYLGGRNTNFITEPEEILNTDKDLDKIPSIISTIVSYGYMATTDYPLSFINNPPGRIANGFVTDVNMSTQFWPGKNFYYEVIYRALFFSADKVYSNLKLDMNSDQHKSFVKWYRQQMDGNHVSTPGYSKCYDPFTGNFTYENQGKGHYQYPYMNDSGARMVFEGVQANFRIQTRVDPSNT